MPAVRGRHEPRLHPSPAVRRDGRRRASVLGLGPAAALGRVASPLAHLVPCAGPGGRDTVPSRRSRHRQVQQFLDRRARTRLRALRHPPRQSRRSAVPPADRDGGQRPVHGCRHPVPCGLDRPRFRRRAAARHAGGAVFPGSSRPRSTSIAAASRTRMRAVTPTRPRRWSEPRAPIARVFGSSAPAHPPKFPRSDRCRRSAPRSSHSSPFGDVVMAWAIRPNASGRSLSAWP